MLRSGVGLRLFRFGVWGLELLSYGVWGSLFGFRGELRHQISVTLSERLQASRPQPPACTSSLNMSPSSTKRRNEPPKTPKKPLNQEPTKPHEHYLGPQTLNPKPSTLDLHLAIPKPHPQTPNAPNPKPQTANPKPKL